MRIFITILPLFPVMLNSAKMGMAVPNLWFCMRAFNLNGWSKVSSNFCFHDLLRKPASWLVAVCERSENRGCGGGGCRKGTKSRRAPVFCERSENRGVGGGGCRKGTKSRRAPVLSARKRSILLDYVPLGNLLTVGYRFPLGPPFWWPERPWGCIGKYKKGSENEGDR